MKLRSDVVNQTNQATVAGTVGVQTSTTTTKPTDAKNTDTSNDAFSKFLKTQLNISSSGEVDEESLYSAIVAQQINALKGEAGSTKFNSLFADAKKEYRSVEEATKWAMMQMQDADDTIRDDLNLINDKAFEAAQLDSNKEVLFDGVGGANDPTKATASLQTALKSAKETIDAFAAGKVPLERPVAVINTGTAYLGSLSSASTPFASTTGSPTTAAVTGTPKGGSNSPSGLKMDGAGGFLFKPVSDNDKKLAVLSPDGLGPLVAAISLKDKNGNLIEEGRFTSFGDDGKTRAKYAFKKPGGSYEKDLTVEIRYIDGTVSTYNIPDPSKRYD
jgi:hypothetical protein